MRARAFRIGVTIAVVRFGISVRISIVIGICIGICIGISVCGVVV